MGVLLERRQELEDYTAEISTAGEGYRSSERVWRPTPLPVSEQAPAILDLGQLFTHSTLSDILRFGPRTYSPHLENIT